MGSLVRAARDFFPHSPPSQEGIKFTKTKEQLRSYCPNIYTLPQKYVPVLTRLYFLGFANLHLASFPMSIYEYSLELLDPPSKHSVTFFSPKLILP